MLCHWRNKFTIGTCRSYRKLCVKKCSFNISVFVRFIIRIVLCVYVRSFWYSSSVLTLKYLFTRTMPTPTALSKGTPRLGLFFLSFHLKKETYPLPETSRVVFTCDDGRRPTCEWRLYSSPVPESCVNERVVYPRTQGHCVCTQQFLNCVSNSG